MARPPRLVRATRLVRSSLGELFDQKKPFGRLALVHCLQASGSTLITVSLAGSLFFSISPDAAESKVLLYLVLTIAPFALVGPALSPLLDRGRQARRTSVALANAGSAILCVAMAKSVHGLLLFPEAFGVLVLGKLYVVARAALVPDVIAPTDDLASKNAMLAVLASLAGFATMPFAVGFLKIGAPAVLVLGAIVFVCGAIASLRLPRPSGRSAGRDAAAEGRPASAAEVARERARLGLPLRPASVLSAIRALTALRAALGFVEFFLAFDLKRLHAPTWWFGLLLVSSGAGALLGSIVVPRLRRRLSERRIIAFALIVVVLGAVGAGLIGNLGAQMLLSFVVAFGPTTARPALDSMVQRDVPPALLGRTFGRIETRLQLFWVLASLIAVLVPIPLRVGDVLVAAGILLAVVSYLVAPARPPRRAAPVAGATISPPTAP